jgi:lipopolysaccharide O-acetyltransferase
MLINFVKIFGDYDFYGIIRIFNSFLYTKLFYRKSRLIRIPFYIRGKKFIDLNKNFTSGVSCRLEAFPIDKKSIVLKFGENTKKRFDQEFDISSVGKKIINVYREVLKC